MDATFGQPNPKTFVFRCMDKKGYDYNYIIIMMSQKNVIHRPHAKKNLRGEKEKETALPLL